VICRIVARPEIPLPPSSFLATFELILLEAKRLVVLRTPLEPNSEDPSLTNLLKHFFYDRHMRGSWSRKGETSGFQLVVVLFLLVDTTSVPKYKTFLQFELRHFYSTREGPARWARAKQSVVEKNLGPLLYLRNGSKKESNMFCLRRVQVPEPACRK
jgi:hypothetical protein